jgi:hypothetical protein
MYLQSYRIFSANLEGQTIFAKHQVIVVVIVVMYLMYAFKTDYYMFQQLLDTLKYNCPIIVMTDNTTKLKLGLQYSAQFCCIVDYSLQEEIQVNSYNDISVIINNIKEEKRS